MQFFLNIFFLSYNYFAFKRASLSTGIRNDKKENILVSVGLTVVVIALWSDSRVRVRAAAPGAVVLVEGGAVVLVKGAVLLFEVGGLGQHGKKPVVGDNFKLSLFNRLKPLLEGGKLQGQSVDRAVDVQDWIVGLSPRGLDGECSFSLLPGPEGEEKESNGDDDTECGSVDDQVRVHLGVL